MPGVRTEDTHGRVAEWLKALLSKSSRLTSREFESLSFRQPDAPRQLPGRVSCSSESNTDQEHIGTAGTQSVSKYSVGVLVNFVSSQRVKSALIVPEYDEQGREIDVSEWTDDEAVSHLVTDHWTAEPLYALDLSTIEDADEIGGLGLLVRTSKNNYLMPYASVTPRPERVRAAITQAAAQAQDPKSPGQTESLPELMARALLNSCPDGETLVASLQALIGRPRQD